MWFIKKIIGDISEVIIYIFKGLKEIKISNHLKINHTILSMNIGALLILIGGFYFCNTISISVSLAVSIVVSIITYTEESMYSEKIFDKFKYLSMIIFVCNVYLVSNNWDFIIEKIKENRTEGIINERID